MAGGVATSSFGRPLKPGKSETADQNLLHGSYLRPNIQDCTFEWFSWTWSLNSFQVMGHLPRNWVSGSEAPCTKLVENIQTETPLLLGNYFLPKKQ